MPIAFADIEGVPLDEMIGNTFGSIFPDMDSKWLRCYERTVLYGDTQEIIDYSSEIDKYLRINCFPTFNGHCGCLIFDVTEPKMMGEKTMAEKAVIMYLRTKMMEQIPSDLEQNLDFRSKSLFYSLNFEF